MSDKEKVCIVCLSEKDLSKHHIIPKIYIKALTLEEKINHSTTERVCRNCHDIYESHARELIKKLAFEVTLPMERAFIIVRNAAKSLLFFKDKNTEERNAQAQAILDDYFFGKEYTREEMKMLIKKPRDDYFMFCERVVDKYGINQLYNIWVNHFEEKMNPKLKIKKNEPKVN